MLLLIEHTVNYSTNAVATNSIPDEKRQGAIRRENSRKISKRFRYLP